MNSPGAYSTGVSFAKKAASCRPFFFLPLYEKKKMLYNKTDNEGVWLVNCMKCGRSAKEGNVFCDACLETMEKYPVKHNATLQLPRRKDEELPKKQARKKAQIPPEERVRQQKRTIRRLSWLVAMLMVTVTLLLGLIVYGLIQEAKAPADNPGKNYTVETDDT